ncbi:MAG: ABC-F family ATP-binding cassette domain-containing protein [Pseudomonadales bacterium]|nr:ABC-F family ATP-binding cassette domain-containing protein [Pseudomonadales bacterium]
MPHETLSIRGVDFSYPSAPQPVITDLTASFPKGFTGVVGPNGAGKSTLLQLATGLLSPDAGTIDGADNAIYCAQRTDEPPGDLERMLDDTGAPVFALRGALGIEWDVLERWETLSHGERKRAQIGAALWRNPDVLAIDEPTNHLDADARSRLLNALSRYTGIGLIVSHDRQLLDEICGQCLWLSPGGATMYPGGYSAMQATREVEAATASRVREKAVRDRNALRREETVRREQEAKSHRARSKRGISNKDHDAKGKIHHMRVTDGGGGKRLRQLEGRIERAEQAAEDATVEKTYRVGIELPGTVCKRDTLFSLPAGELPMGDARRLRYPDLVMRPADRIALTGANGLGKSTLLDFIRANLNVEAERIIYMPQELTAAQGAKVLADVKALPKDELGHAMTVVSCLGSRPAQLLDSNEPSPGEVRKLLLALGMTKRPYLLILDEPTNHLDLPSVEALEAALAACSCGMLLVSHDSRFLDALTSTQWRIEAEGADSIVLTD